MFAFPPYAPILLRDGVLKSNGEDPSTLITVLVITAVLVIGIVISAVLEDINKNKKNKKNRRK
jgi:hypothetical protein